MVFNDDFSYLTADSAKTFRDFCPCPDGSESEKILGEEAPLWGEFNGEVENLTPNFTPPNYPMAAVRDGLNAGASVLPKFISPATCAFKFGRKKIFSEKFFFRTKTAGQNRAGMGRLNRAPQLHRSNLFRCGRYRHCLGVVGNGIPR